MSRRLRLELSDDAVRLLAGERFYERGVDYWRRGKVESLVERAGAVRAQVRGTRLYEVELRADGGLSFYCTCPVNYDGLFCKHCVAAALAYVAGLDDGAAGVETESGDRGHRAEEHDGALAAVRDYLSAQEKETLVELLMRQALDDDRLRGRLLIKAGRPGIEGPDARLLRAAVDRAVRTRGFVAYEAAWDYAAGIHEVIDTIEELLTEGHAAEVVDVSEHALRAVEGVMGNVDDSDGGIGDVLGRLQAVHHDACEAAAPDPVELARRLFDWELRSDWDVFRGAAARYAGVLGERGLDEYRRLAEAEWKEVPTCAPGEDDMARFSQHFAITYMMETLAKVSGDIEELVAVKSRNLSHAFSFLEIGQIYRDAGSNDQALAWAEKGLETFPTRTDSRLRAFLADEYHRRGRHGEAMEVVWTGFTDDPGLEVYQELKDHAQRAGTWPAWRDRALSLLRERADHGAREHAGARSVWLMRAGSSELVRILLWENEIEAAWREAKSGGCHDSLWLKLADLRADEHPEDALPIYRDRVEPAIQCKTNQAYEEAAELLRKVGKLMQRTGRDAEFPAYLAEIEERHRRKRNFMRLLAAIR